MLRGFPSVSDGHDGTLIGGGSNALCGVSGAAQLTAAQFA